MDDRRCLRAGGGKGVHMCHHVMAQLLFLPGREVIVNVVQMKAHLFKLRVCDGQTKGLLTLRQSEPEPSPCGKLLLIREDPLHLFPGIAGTKRVLITVVHVILPYKSGSAGVYVRSARGSGAWLQAHFYPPDHSADTGRSPGN